MGHQLIKGCSRRMAYLKSVACGDKLATIPPTGRRVHRQQVDQRGEKEYEKCVVTLYQLTTDLLKISSHSSVTISLTKLLSTEEKSREAG